MPFGIFDISFGVACVFVMLREEMTMGNVPYLMIIFLPQASTKGLIFYCSNNPG